MCLVVEASLIASGRKEARQEGHTFAVSSLPFIHDGRSPLGFPDALSGGTRSTWRATAHQTRPVGDSANAPPTNRLLRTTHSRSAELAQDSSKRPSRGNLLGECPPAPEIRSRRTHARHETVVAPPLDRKNSWCVPGSVWTSVWTLRNREVLPNAK